MQRLSGLDASFLYAEGNGVPMHTLKIAVLDGKPAPRDRLVLLKRVLAEKLPHLPAFRKRVVAVPFGLDHPRWVEDPDLDLDEHVRRRLIPEPRTMREAEQVIAQIAAEPLSHDRPLWEIWLLEALNDGSVVVLAKVHHALADGTASVEMLARVMSEVPGQSMPAPEPVPAEPMPTRGALVKSALSAQLERARALPSLLSRTAQGGVRALRHLAKHGKDLPRPFECPRTPYNKSLVRSRSFATSIVPLAPALEVKTKLGVTLNDVVLYLVSVGLERELAARGCLPTRPLLVSVPMAVGSGDSTRRLTGNRLANLFTSLCTNVSDPVERVRAIALVTQRSKEAQRELGLSTMLEWSELLLGPPYGALMRLFYASHLADHVPAPANAIVSNVAGPRAPLYIAGTRLQAMYSVGPLVEGMALNITIWSYAGQLTFSVLADGEAVAEPHRITDAIAPALQALHGLCEGGTP
jgi:diacylglycerol O-acyltransferase